MLDVGEVIGQLNTAMKMRPMQTALLHKMANTRCICVVGFGTTEMDFGREIC